MLNEQSLNSQLKLYVPHSAVIYSSVIFATSSAVDLFMSISAIRGVPLSFCLINVFFGGGGSVHYGSQLLGNLCTRIDLTWKGLFGVIAPLRMPLLVIGHFRINSLPSDDIRSCISTTKLLNKVNCNN